MIFRLKEPARFYIHFMSRDRPIDDSGPILFQLISVRTCLFMFLFCGGNFSDTSWFYLMFWFCRFSEILLQHHFLEMGALMSPLTLMALIRTNWSNKASIIQQWQKRNINEREGMGNWKVWNSISDVIIFCSKARPCLVLLNQLPFVLCCCYIYLYVI